MKKFFIVLSVCGLILSSVYAAGQKENDNSSDAVKLLFWHTFGDGKESASFEKVIELFESENPNITIDSVRMPFDGLQQQVIAAVAGGVAPDVMRMDPTWVGKIASMGGIIALDKLDGFNACKKNALEGPMNTTYLKGNYYGLPLGTNTTVAIWNIDLLKKIGISEIPSTMDELVQVAKNYSNIKEEQYFFTIAGTYTWAMLPWFWSLGGNVTNSDYTKATGYLDSEDSINALEEIANWYQEGIISPAIVGEQPDSWSASTGGTLPMVVDGPWFFTSVDLPFDAKATMIPSGKGGSVSIVGGEDIVMLEGTKHKESAWKFMQFLVSDEAQLLMANAGIIPTTKSAIDKMQIDDSSYLNAFLKQLNSTQVRVPSENYPEIDTYLTTVFEKVVRGEQSSKEALTEAAKKIDELLK